jgi:hypothetical protein
MLMSHSSVTLEGNQFSVMTSPRPVAQMGHHGNHTESYMTMGDSQASLYGSQAGTTRNQVLQKWGDFFDDNVLNGKLVGTKLWDMQTMTPCFLKNNKLVTERSFSCWCFLDASTVMVVRVTDLLTWFHLTIRFHHVPVWKWLRLHVIDNDVSMLLIDPSFAIGGYDWSRLHSLSDIRWSWWYFMFLDYHPTIKRGKGISPMYRLFSCQRFHDVFLWKFPL